ncbi:putative amidase [Drosera capensis]
MLPSSPSPLLLLITLLLFPLSMSLTEPTISSLQAAFADNRLTSKQLTLFYLTQIKNLNPTLHSVVELNPNAINEAEAADDDRKRGKQGSGEGVHGIPILIKDNIVVNGVNSKGFMNTSAGSFALVGARARRDAGVVRRLRRGGAVVIGKASLSEWANFRSTTAPSGWCARSGQGRNPYNLSADPCGSSSGSAISVAANMVSVSLGTETDGSILCPSSSNSVVGIKPTLGLTSRAGVIPISPRQDTVGPICRTVSDAVQVLDVIVGFDKHDAEATKAASIYIPVGGYKQFLKHNGLRTKRLGIVRNPFFNFAKGSPLAPAFKNHLRTLRRYGAVLLDNLEIANISTILYGAAEMTALEAEFKVSLNKYLKELIISPARSLADVIAFNDKHSVEEKIKEYGQDVFIASEATKGIDAEVEKARATMEELTRNGFEKIVLEYELDAVVTPGAGFSSVLAIGGFPGISVPAGYDENGVPFGICFGGLKGYEPRLIEIAFAFEQATKIRKPPPLHAQGSLYI